MKREVLNSMISVVIPAFNRATTISRAIHSVLNQTCKNLELIVVDDCSNDNTNDVVMTFTDPRVRYIKHKVNQGACVARNTGIKNAEGEYIAFLDSDDAWQPDKLEKQLSAMEKFNADICFCSLHRHNYPADKAECYPNLESGVISYDQLLMKSIVSTQTIVAKKNITDKYLFDPLVKQMQDYDWIIRAGEKNRVAFVKDAIVDVYFQNDSLTSTDYLKLLTTYEFFLNKYKYLFNKYPQFHIKLLSSIGVYKTKLGRNASKEFKEIFEIKKDSKSLLKYCLAQVNLLKIFYK